MAVGKVKSRTFLPSGVLQLRVAGNHDDFDHEAVAALPNHVDHLAVANLHHILAIYLTHTNSSIASFFLDAITWGENMRSFSMSHITVHGTEGGNLLMA